MLRTTAPHLLTGMDQVSQIYAGSAAGADMGEMQTMHTSDANLASRRLMNHN